MGSFRGGAGFAKLSWVWKVTLGGDTHCSQLQQGPRGSQRTVGSFPGSELCVHLPASLSTSPDIPRSAQTQPQPQPQPRGARLPPWSLETPGLCTSRLPYPVHTVLPSPQSPDS